MSNRRHHKIEAYLTDSEMADLTEIAEILLLSDWAEKKSFSQTIGRIIEDERDQLIPWIIEREKQRLGEACND